MTILPRVEAAYVREYLDNRSRLNAGFANAPVTAFQVRDPKIDRDRARFGAGITAQITAASQLDFSYQGEIAGTDDHHAFGATYRLSWL